VGSDLLGVLECAAVLEVGGDAGGAEGLAAYGRTLVRPLPASFPVRRRGSTEDGRDIDVATCTEHVEEDAVVTHAAAKGGLGLLELHNVSREGIDAHALDGSVDAGEVGCRQLIELLLRAFGDADAPGVPRARLGTAHKGLFYRPPLRLGRV